MAPPPRLSRELALLAAVDLASDEDLAISVAAARHAAFDWPRFVALARGHGMATLAGGRLVPLAGPGIPTEILDSLRAAWRAGAAATIAQSAQAASLSALLTRAGIGSIVLKGTALANLLYAPHPEWRRSDDIDVLVEAAGFAEADEILRNAGYRRTWPEGELPTRGLDMLLHLANVFTYLAPGTGQAVELHHRISLNPHWLPVSFAQLRTHAVEIETAGGPLLGLDGPLHVSYLAWHALGHSGYRLKWFCDIVRALRRGGAESCRDYLADRPFQLSQRPLEVADRVLAVIADAMGQRQPPPQNGFGKAAANRVLVGLERADAIPTGRSLAALSGELTDLAFLLWLAPDGAARRYQLLRSVSDPRDVYTLGLPRRCAPFYAAVGPFLAVGRLLGRRRREPAP